MHRIRNLLILLTALASLSAIYFAASASAFPVYKYSTHFGSYGTGNGQFEYPDAAATDSAGNFWVVDQGTYRVQKLNSKGEYLLQPTGSPYGLSGPTDVAVTSSNNIWVVDRSGERIVEFNSAGEYIREFGELGSGPGQFWYPTHIAIDSSGNLWVTDESNHRVQEFNAEGKYIRQFGSEGTGNGQFTYMTGIATDASNNVWVVDSPGESSRIEEFNSSGTYLKQIAGGGTLSSTVGDVLTINGGYLWVADTHHNCIKVLNVNGEVLTQFGGLEESEGAMTAVSGVTFDPSGNPWVVNPGSTPMEKWVPSPPVATTEAATGIKGSEAVLNAKIDPEGSSTTYQFEYGTTVSYGSKVPASPASAGSGVGAVAVKQAVTGLTSNTTYHYRVVATSAAGTTVGADKTFKSAATVQWYTGATEGGTTLQSGNAPVSGKLGEFTFATGSNAGKSATAFEINGWRPSGLESEVVFTASSAELVEAINFNQAGAATGSGSLRLKGVTMSRILENGSIVPFTCRPVGSAISASIGLTPMVAAEAYEYLGVVSFTLKFEKSGTSPCPLETHKFELPVYAAAPKLSSPSLSHTFEFSKAIETKAGGAPSLWFEGSLIQSLSGSFAGKYWEAK